jgi:1-aminocyclopropane-1-carboxylate deaminase/D-cysteine desulfhydrase-like pyridoxal-dependent ACC family enzyme
MRTRANPKTLSIGRYPTPVELLTALSKPGCDLWVKRDDLTHEAYGGNKVRKLERVLAEVCARGAKRIVTVGAVGSHHVLATALFGRRAGLEVEAVLLPQPRTAHVLEVLRADMALGLRAFPVGSWGAAAVTCALRIASGAQFVAIGGSSVAGSMGYVDAAHEVAAQVRAGMMPEPDVCVVALGSGGTAAGLAAGFAVERMKTRVVGVCVAEPPWLSRLASAFLALACRRRSGKSTTAKGVLAHLASDRRFLGPGYGWPTPEGDEATRVARDATGLVLDPTYTAKAFACALWHLRARQAHHVLYWHTLSSASMHPLLENAPTLSALDPALSALASC